MKHVLERGRERQLFNRRIFRYGFSMQGKEAVMAAYSKSKVDKAGYALAGNLHISDEAYLELEDVFDDYRKSHLQPLSEITLELQQWLASYGRSYYIAQRLKRKPQIVRKLNRLSVRLTQLQDIGWCRIVYKNERLSRKRSR